MDLPLHPALTHIPLSLALLLPVLIGALAWLLWRERARGGVWLLVVGLQVVLVGSATVATFTGETDARQVERVTGRAAIDAHEDAAQLFLLAAVLTLGLLLAALGFKERALALTLAAGALALATTALGLRTGYRGGELVYRHGAARAHEAYAPRREAEAEPKGEPAPGSR